MTIVNSTPARPYGSLARVCRSARSAVGALVLLFVFSDTGWAQDACYPWLASPGGINHYYPTAQAACSVYNVSGTNSLGGTTVTTHSAINFSGSSPSQQAQCLAHEVQTDGGTGICSQNPAFCHPPDSIAAATWQVPQGCGYWAGARPLSNGECSTCDPQGDPINPALASVYKTEDDLIEALQGGIAFRRFFNGSSYLSGDLGPNWRHSFSRSIAVINIPDTPLFYPGSSSTTSALYTTMQNACLGGFADIQASIPQWQSASVAWDGMHCTVQNGTQALGTLQIFSSYPSTPLTQATEFDVYRDDGHLVRFPVVGGIPQTPPGESLTLEQTATGFSLVDENDTMETYDTSGHLLSVTARSGVSVALTYDASNRLSTATDSFGHSLALAYNPQNRLISVTASGGGIWQYGFDAISRLSNVTYPDSTKRTYVYENNTYPYALTGVVDENNTRFSTWTYDSQGRAQSSQEAGGANAVTLTYNSMNSVTATDALGAARTLTYARFGDRNRPISISGSPCAQCADGASTSYDNQGFVSSRTDYDGNLTCYMNDPSRGLELVRVEGFVPGSTCPSNLFSYTPMSGTRQRKIATSWNPTFREPSTVTEANRTTSFTYDASGNTLTKTITDTSVTPNVTRTWTYTYDSYGRVLTADGPRMDVADVTTYTYYTCTTGFECGQLKTVTNAAGQTTTYNTYNAYGQPLTITDPNGIVTTLTYDARQRLTSRQTANETTAFDYWPTGLLKKVTLPDASYLAYTYDGAHRLTQITDALGNKTVHTLDAMGNRTAENTYDPANALHRTHTRVINTLNQLWKDVNAAGTAAVTTTFGYDAQGNQTSIAAPLARNTTNGYDELNRLKQITDPANGITQFGYDANDNLTSVTDPRSLVTAYVYNGFGDLNTQTSPDTGTTANTYDSAGNLATSTDARGAVSTYTYDALNRVSSVAYSHGGSTDQTIIFTYDTGTNGKGHLTGASDANHTLSWSYDPLGRVTGKTQTVASVTKSVGYAYTNGNLTTVTTPSGQTVTYGYNGNHQVTSVAVNGTTILNSVTYEPLGPVSGWTWGNGTTTTRTYDTDGKISQIASAGTKTYSYDDAFRITGLTDTSPGAANWTYGYDSLDRLTSGTSPSVTRGWTYDANGNRLTETGTTPSTYTIAPSSNRITGITGALARSYAYDNAGNSTGYSTVSATYNNAGRLQTLANGSSTETAIYNALGQRIRISGGVNGTVLYAYDEAGHLLGEYDGTGALIEETVWLGDIPVATLRPSGATVTIFYVHSDQLNTPRQVTRPSDNTPMWTWNSDSFGTDAANPNPAGAGTFTYNLRFPGQVFDGQAGLHYNYARNYDSATGRYVESDPIGLRSGPNTYAYVLNNPIAWRDPLGLTPWDWDGIGDTSVCKYYEDQAQQTHCPYYDGAMKACRGQRRDINLLLKIGIAQAWVVHSTTASESQIFDTIRRGLIRYDQYTRQRSSVGCGGDCPPGNWIDLYHNIVFESAGISPFFYGGNLTPQGVGPNFVPYDFHGKPSWDPRQWF